MLNEYTSGVLEGCQNTPALGVSRHVCSFRGQIHLPVDVSHAFRVRGFKLGAFFSINSLTQEVSSEKEWGKSEFGNKKQFVEIVG